MHQPDGGFTREDLVEELRRIIEWVSKIDSSVGTTLDSVVHDLEVLAVKESTKLLEEALAEKNAAQADLLRIRAIVGNPLVISDSAPTNTVKTS